MFQEIEWQGFKGFAFAFEGLPAKLIKPNCKPNGKWLLKAEYFDAFPETEIELLNRGWHLAYNQNYNRWAEDLDLRRKSAFLATSTTRAILIKKKAFLLKRFFHHYYKKTALVVRPHTFFYFWE